MVTKLSILPRSPTARELRQGADVLELGKSTSATVSYHSRNMPMEEVNGAAFASSGAIRLSPDHLGLGRISDNPAGAIDLANHLLQRNHDENHIFWRDVGGHNHIPHAILSTLAMGGGVAEIQRANDDGISIQRPIPACDKDLVKALQDPTVFRAHIGNLDHYTNFLLFFENEIRAKGWKAVVQEYVFDRTPVAETILAQLYEGAFHPLIHFGFGVEFQLPSIIAEGLAQAAVHDSAGLENFYQQCEQRALNGATTRASSLLELYDQARANNKLRMAARLPDGPVRVRDGVLGRANTEITEIAARFTVEAEEESIERATAEMINVAAFVAGAAQRRGKARKIDFFHMHNVNASIFLTTLIKQPWISLSDKARMVEMKARTDLVWYCASSAPELRREYIQSYEPTHSKGMNWQDLYAAVNVAHDDGHVAKFVRALKNGELESQKFKSESAGQGFEIQGQTWFRLAQLAYDTTLDLDPDDKWIWGAGFDPLWFKIPPYPDPLLDQQSAPIDPASVQRATLDRFIAAWSEWSAKGMIAEYSGNFVQVTLPFSSGVPIRVKSQVEETLPILQEVVTDYKLTVHEVIHDVARRKAAVYALSTAKSPFGDWNNEYAVFVTFSETGDSIVKIAEMGDTAFMRDFFPQFLGYLHERVAP